MSSLQDYNEKLEAIKSIPDDQVTSPKNIPVDNYLQEAEYLYHWVMEDKDELCARGLDWNLVEDLPVRAGALREAQARWITVRFSHADAETEWLKRSPDAYDLRNEMIHDFRFAYRKDPYLLGRVREIDEGTGHADMIQDLTSLSILGMNNPEPLKAINFDLSVLDEAAQASGDMADLLGAANAERLGCNEVVKLRNLAYTYLKLAVDEIRNCGQYIFWKDEKRLTGYGSSYLRRVRGKYNLKKEKPGAPV